MKIQKVYIASPLFNPAEKYENDQIDAALREAGFGTFLPQRDGFLYDELVGKLKNLHCTDAQAEKIALNIIFHLDVYMVCRVCDATVFNMNGRVPDEGAVIEAALCFARERPLVIYKQDARSLIGGKDNPLVSGLTGFEIAGTIEEIPVKLKEIENQRESMFSKTMRIAEVLFKDYSPENKDFESLAKYGKEIFSDSL